jgi:hypothetical protein
MPLTETGIAFFQQPNLFLSQIKDLTVLFLLQSKQSLIFGFDILFYPDIPYRTGGYGNTFQSQNIGKP